MSRYHKIVMNGEKLYRGFNEATGYYENEVLTERELIEQLLGEVVESVIEIDKGQVGRAISCASQTFGLTGCNTPSSSL